MFLVIIDRGVEKDLFNSFVGMPIAPCFKHRETLNSKSALFNGFFRLEKLSIFETLGVRYRVALVETMEQIMTGFGRSMFKLARYRSTQA